MNFRDAVNAAYSAEFNGKRFVNDQQPRLSGQSYGANPAKLELTFQEFLDSFFGSDRLDIPYDPINKGHMFELDHIGEVLDDNVIE
jgi:hypothetical protein